MERVNQIFGNKRLEMDNKKLLKKRYIKFPENWKELTELEKKAWIEQFYEHVIKQLREEEK